MVNATGGGGGGEREGSTGREPTAVAGMWVLCPTNQAIEVNRFTIIGGDSAATLTLHRRRLSGGCGASVTAKHLVHCASWLTRPGGGATRPGAAHGPRGTPMGWGPGWAAAAPGDPRGPGGPGGTGDQERPPGGDARRNYRGLPQCVGGQRLPGRTMTRRGPRAGDEGHRQTRDLAAAGGNSGWGDQIGARLDQVGRRTSARPRTDRSGQRLRAAGRVRDRAIRAGGR